MSEKILVIGAEKFKGKSKRTGENYDFSKIYLCKQARGAGNEGDGTGFSVEDYNIDSEVYESLKAMKREFPVACKVSFGISRNKSIHVVGVEVVG